MHKAEMESIVILPDRQRKDFNEEAMIELMNSIESKGLLHPIIVRTIETGQIALVAGERRLRAMKRLHEAGKKVRCNGEVMMENIVPFLYVTDLSPLEYAEAELEENVCRKDLTWVEQAVARKKLYDLRKAAAAAKGEHYNVEKFSNELKASGVSSASMRDVYKDLSVAQYLDRPEVAKAADKDTALKAAKKSTESSLLSALSSLVDERIVKPKHTFIAGDCLEVVKTLEPRRYDCVLTDPPYGIDIDSAGDMVSNDHHYTDTEEYLHRILEQLPDQLYRITREQAHVYWFCDFRRISYISYALEQAGFAVCPHPIIWWKRGKSMAPDITRWPKRTYECILYAIKGDKAPLKVAGDVIATPYTSDLQQAEKPHELFVELLARSVLAGSQVIDPFCGSGVIFTAAHEAKCIATGIELHPDRGNLAKLRATGEDQL